MPIGGRSGALFALIGLGSCLPVFHANCQLAKYPHYTTNPGGLWPFQNQVVLEGLEGSTTLLTSQSVAVLRWAGFLERAGRALQFTTGQ